MFEKNIEQMFYMEQVFHTELIVHANDFSPLTPEWWVQEGLATLEEYLRLGSYVSRDYEDEIAEAGDIVHVNRTDEIEGKRLPRGGAVTQQDLNPEEILVKLNQHLYDSFYISDRELRSSFDNLKTRYINPAMRGIAKQVEAVLHAEALNFYETCAGSYLTDPDYDDLVDLNVLMNENNCPQDERLLVVGPRAEGALLKTDKLTEYRMTEDGSPIINGVIARGSGFNIAMSQAVPFINENVDVFDTGEINNAAGYKRGDSVLTVDGIVGAVVSGMWCKIEGELTPHLITAHSETSSNTTSITIHPALSKNIVDNADLTVFNYAAVNLSGGYAEGWEDWIVIDGVTNFPQKGQGITVGTSSGTLKVYGVLNVDQANNKILLSQPLYAALADDAKLFLMPSGTVNPALTRSAITMVNRPLEVVMAGAGARSAIASYGGLSIRLSISWDSTYLKHKYLFDTLIGTKTIDKNQGGLLLN